MQCTLGGVFKEEVRDGISGAQRGSCSDNVLVVGSSRGHLLFDTNPLQGPV